MTINNQSKTAGLALEGLRRATGDAGASASPTDARDAEVDAEVEPRARRRLFSNAWCLALPSQSPGITRLIWQPAS